VLAESDPRDDPAPLVEAFLNRKGGADALAAALTRQTPPVDVAKLALRHMYSVGRSDKALSDTLSAAAGIAVDPPPPTPAEVARLAADVEARGNAARGELVFRRADMSCLKCHALHKAGGDLGPELTSVGAVSPVEFVVSSILNPNLAIKEQYVTKIFQTVNGEVFTGIVLSRDAVRVQLKEASGKTITIPTADIEEEAEGQSLMPQGLAKFLTRDELVDLAKFVSELGKPGPYAVRTAPMIQRWRLFGDMQAIKSLGEKPEEAPTMAQFEGRILGSDAWQPVYARASGELPLDELRTRRPGGDGLRAGRDQGDRGGCGDGGDRRAGEVPRMARHRDPPRAADLHDQALPGDAQTDAAGRPHRPGSGGEGADLVTVGFDRRGRRGRWRVSLGIDLMSRVRRPLRIGRMSFLLITAAAVSGGCSPPVAQHPGGATFETQVAAVRAGSATRIVADAPLTAAEWESLRGLAGLRELVLRRGVADDARAEILATLPGIERLVLRESPLSDVGFREIAGCRRPRPPQRASGRLHGRGCAGAAAHPHAAVAAAWQQEFGRPGSGCGGGGACFPRVAPPHRRASRRRRARRHRRPAAAAKSLSRRRRGFRRGVGGVFSGASPRARACGPGPPRPRPGPGPR